MQKESLNEYLYEKYFRIAFKFLFFVHIFLNLLKPYALLLLAALLHSMLHIPGNQRTIIVLASLISDFPMHFSILIFRKMILLFSKSSFLLFIRFYSLILYINKNTRPPINLALELGIIGVWE